MRLFIVRHADPDYENHTITSKGHREARALAKRLGRLKPDMIYCSPLGRAIHTMQYTARALKKKPVILDWLRELSEFRIELPPWGQLMAWDTPPEILRSPKRKNFNSIEDIPFLRALPIKDKMAYLQSNSDHFFEKLGYKRLGGRYRILFKNRGKIVVFCHGGLALTWLSLLLEIPLPLMWGNFWLAPASITTLLFDERSEQWATPRIIGLCDVSHLHSENIPVSAHGLKANTE